MAYFITNGNKYLHINKNDDTTPYDTVDNIHAANYFRKDEANDILLHLNNDEHWGLRKIRNHSGGKNYIITTASSFVSTRKDIPFVPDYQYARAFQSIADAEAYIRNNDTFDGDEVIFDRVSGTSYKPEIKRFTEEQLQVLGIENNDKKTKRVYIPKVTKRKVFENCKGVCAICGRKVESNNFTIDHIIPLNRGGTNELSNYQIACGTCNKLKDDSLDSEYMVSATTAINNKIATGDSEAVKDMVYPIIRTYVRSIINQMLMEEN